MKTNDDPSPTQPKELTKVGDWCFRHFANSTEIYDGDGKLIITFYDKLSLDEVHLFRYGYSRGRWAGLEAGKAIKAEEIRKSLGL